jgi:nucleoside-specific outer membrane channel protein Tsx
LATWNRSTFNKQKSREILTNDFDHPSESINEENLLPLHRLHWVSEKVLTLYAEHGSYRSVGEVTGIPYSTVFRLVKEAKIKIKKLI